MKVEVEANQVVRKYARRGLFDADREVAEIMHGKGCSCKTCVQSAVHRWNFFSWLLGSNRDHFKAVPTERGYEIQINQDDNSGTV